jgi:hypothetical protein
LHLLCSFALLPQNLFPLAWVGVALFFFWVMTFDVFFVSFWRWILVFFYGLDVWVNKREDGRVECEFYGLKMSDMQVNFWDLKNLVKK